MNVEFHTFSIVGRCPRTGAFGVAVSTARPAVGAAVPWVGPNGAIATQAMTNTEIGREGLRRLEAGVPIGDALAALLTEDPMRARRQVHGVGRGGVFVHTGGECKPWCGHRVGDGFSVAGNLLTGPAVLEAIAAAFSREADAELGARLLGALEAGQAAGGDSRGRQSAALLVTPSVVSKVPPAIFDPRQYELNIRVDEHADPVPELRRIFELLLAQVAAARDKSEDALDSE